VIADAHCHFFSAGFFRSLARDLPAAPDDPAAVLPARLGWAVPGDDAALADRWVQELDRFGVARAMLIASVSGDEPSVAAAAARHPARFVGAFMFNPIAEGASGRLEQALADPRLRTVCLFPAMHGYTLDDERATAVFAAAASRRRAVFVHCGLLSVGVRKKLNLPSRFDIRRGDPLAVAAVALRHPDVPVIIPHFGAGFFREALMAADLAANVFLDTSSSNGWIKYHPNLTLRDVFARALDCVGPSRLLFGTDSSFFPRGWHQAVYDAERAVLDDLNVPANAQAEIFGGNFSRIFTP